MMITINMIRVMIKQPIQSYHNSIDGDNDESQVTQKTCGKKEI